MRNGIVPVSEIDTLSIGYEQYRTAFLGNLAALRNHKTRPHPLFVTGEWGSGKSHCLTYIRNLCQREGIPNSALTITAGTHKLNHFQRAYPALVQSLEVDGIRGLQAILVKQLKDTDRPLCRILPLLPPPKGLPVPTLHSRPSAKVRLYEALSAICAAIDNEIDPLSDPILWTVPLGGDLNTDSRPTCEKALDRIEELSTLFHAIDSTGLVLFFDEVETIDQLRSITQRRMAYNVIGRLMAMPYVWVIFAITNRFTRQLDIDRDRVFERREWGFRRHDVQGAQFLFDHIDGNEFEPLSPPTLDRDGAEALAQRVTDVYQRAYDTDDSAATDSHRVVRQWSRDPARNPRVLMRMLINDLDTMRPLPGIAPGHHTSHASSNRNPRPSAGRDDVILAEGFIDRFQQIQWMSDDELVTVLTIDEMADFARMLETKSCIPLNANREAMRLYRHAARNGHADAQFKLGHLYYRLSADLDSAITWWTAAANNRHVEAMHWLACCYWLGDGVSASNADAYRWVLIANSHAAVEPVGYRDEPSDWRIRSTEQIDRMVERLENDLTPGERVHSKQLATEWLTVHPKD
jgi:hypothetical protein